MLHLSATFLDPSLRSFTFVRSKVDREGFFRQIKEYLLILAKEVALTNESVNIATVDEDVASTNLEFDQSSLICNLKRRPNMIYSVGFKSMTPRCQQQIKLQTLIYNLRITNIFSRNGSETGKF